MTTESLPALLERQRSAFMAEGFPALETRLDRLDRCLAIVVDHQQAIIDAINSDFGSRSRHVTLMTDLFTSVSALKFVKKHLKGWMKPVKRRPPVPMGLFGATTRIHYQPKGVVGLMTPWNVPVNMVFTPLADILGAGNRCLVKPSEYTPATSALLDGLFTRYFDDTEVKVVNGGADVGAAFSALPFDHLIFTGATGIGRHIMAAAAKNLTPVTLELGGKSPVIIGERVDMEDAVGKLIAGKTLNAGQLCVAPDYCFVPEAKLEAFLSECKRVFASLYPHILGNPDWVAVVNERHRGRILSYIDDAVARDARVIALNPKNEDFRAHPSRQVPLHLVVNPADDCLVMQEEIFGPILAVRAYRSIDEAIATINRRPRALALYYFGTDTAEQQRIIDSTCAGGMTINDIAMHVSCDDMPFGGIGASGMGHYHGREGFLTFSHAKSVYSQGFINLAKLAGTLPPYGPNVDKMMKGQIKK